MMDERERLIIEALAAAETVCLSSHEYSDGDSLGALLGLSQVLRGQGKEVRPAIPDDAGLPLQYRFLPGREMLVAGSEIPAAPEVFVALDCGNLDRLAGLKEKAAAARTLINIDHHEDNAAFGHLNLVVPYASSTAEIAFSLVQEAGWKLNLEAATCFYTGLLTDTGRFRHQNTSAATFRAAAELVDLGVDPQGLVARIYEQVSVPYLRLTGRVMERARLLESYPLIYSSLGQSDLEEMGVAMSETEDLIDHLRVVGEAQAVLLLKEQEDGRLRASMRSIGDVSVGEVARRFGGGGHARAAGFTSDAPMHEVVETVAAALIEQAAKAT